MLEANIVGVKMLPDEDNAVKERLRVLLQLAVAIGKREGLLGKELVSKVKQPEAVRERKGDGNGDKRCI